MKIFKHIYIYKRLLLSFIIILIVAAVVMPMMSRCQLDTKYSVARRKGTSLAGYAAQWAEKSIQAQDESTSTATLKDYYASLAGVAPGGALPAPGNACPGEWIATDGSANSNWAYTDALASPPTRKAKAISGRCVPEAAGVDSAPDTVVEDQAVQSGRVLPNPFNHVIVFREPNFPSGGAVVPGALAFGCFAEPDGHLYFAFAYQGTESSTTDLNRSAEETTFHAGMGLHSLWGLRNGVFAGRFK